MALKLATDVTEVAMPMVEFSQVLTDGNLIDIVRTRSEDMQTAAARRGMVSELFPVARVAIDVVQELEYNGLLEDRERFRNRMIERVLTQFETGFDSDNLEYLMAKLGVRAHAEAGTVAAPQ